jgi:hypothetical protein
MIGSMTLDSKHPAAPVHKLAMPDVTTEQALGGGAARDSLKREET